MKPQYSLSSFSIFLLFLHCPNTFAQPPAAAPAQAPAVVASPPAATPTQAAASHGITNVTKILEKAGHFTIFIRLLRSTQEENHLFSALNDSSTGLAIFAPTDSAFLELKSGTLNTLSDGDKSELVKFHVIPTFLSPSQFQTLVLEGVFRISSSEDSSSDGGQRGGQLRGWLCGCVVGASGVASGGEEEDWRWYVEDAASISLYFLLLPPAFCCASLCFLSSSSVLRSLSSLSFSLSFSFFFLFSLVPLS
ncbi:hypothetical protein POTOM_058641 [Populus tomentosa]|uniref:FAS1 domain-containing protein n=1 Tax=Populus tomentosa TaxID=118781 RepID=A0A8X7XV02_POPTO|nr:hypothetical protein POTOM_058641 [Populus tomentosa]